MGLCLISHHNKKPELLTFNETYSPAGYAHAITLNNPACKHGLLIVDGSDDGSGRCDFTSMSSGTYQILVDQIARNHSSRQQELRVVEVWNIDANVTLSGMGNGGPVFTYALFKI